MPLNPPMFGNFLMPLLFVEIEKFQNYLFFLDIIVIMLKVLEMRAIAHINSVTNKTVSRWETGKYMPPIECLKLLSDIYQISINEILTSSYPF